MVALGEVTRAERNTEGRAHAIDLDDEQEPVAELAAECSGSESGATSDDDSDSESEAVMGGRAVSMSPLVMGSQLELSQDYE